uniref:Uncharacterized protein n=1 Tax=Panagrolaimus sp. JU765 TaxID=591449 RepID=A0AC34R1R7_9BILA
MFAFGGTGECEVEKEKPRLLPSMFPNFAQILSGFPPRNFPLPNGGPNMPTSSPSSASGSSVFPMFPANFGPYYALLQQNQLMAHLAKNGLNSSNSESGSSAMESRASSADSDIKKIQTDADGNIICPVCDQKLPSNANLELHLEQERKNLIAKIEKIREQKTKSNFENLSEKTQISSRNREKREAELQRIRLNQQKRLSWKNIGPLTSRNSENACFAADKNYCKGCERQQEFLVISSTLDEPRCLDCFQKYRRQTTFLPSSITESPVDDKCSLKSSPSTPSSLLNHTVDELLSLGSPGSKRRRPLTSEDLVEEKRIKIEV